MEKLQDEIAKAFLDKLKDSSNITSEIVEGLLELLSGKKKLKADDLVKLFASPPGGDAK